MPEFATQIPLPLLLSNKNPCKRKAARVDNYPMCAIRRIEDSDCAGIEYRAAGYHKNRATESNMNIFTRARSGPAADTGKYDASSTLNLVFVACLPIRSRMSHTRPL